MLEILNTETFGWEAAVRGARNPLNSWNRMDSCFCWDSDHERCESIQRPSFCDDGSMCHFCLGPNDLALLKKLSSAGPDHAKYLRMINVTFDITAPLYWWKEFDTYKVGTVANSCSTMHKIQDKEFTLDDFSHEHLKGLYLKKLKNTIVMLNDARAEYYHAKTKPMKDESKRAEKMKKWWWQMIQLLPSSYNQRRTVQLNYQVLKNIYFARRNHKLDEWHTFCDWALTLPYFKEVCVDVMEGRA